MAEHADSVPVPVRSVLRTPWSRTRRMRSRYCLHGCNISPIPGPKSGLRVRARGRVDGSQHQHRAGRIVERRGRRSAPQAAGAPHEARKIQADQENLGEPDHRIAQMQRRPDPGGDHRGCRPEAEAALGEAGQQEAAEQQLLRQRRADADRPAAPSARLSPCSSSLKTRRSPMTISGRHHISSAVHTPVNANIGISPRPQDAPAPARGPQRQRLGAIGAKEAGETR